ncbi:aclacinomycin methylesterase RdmC [Microbulbifer aestuariivivens]|uniref:Aclacinomycin methylesterase RdmC n=1 Tax=Microbulbifer aestuariivivens TaxID=1908308 RepID=A0ABP9WNP1_9GAMM
MAVLFRAFVLALLFGVAAPLAVAEPSTADNPFDRYPLRFVSIDDVAIAYQDMGPRDAEPVLLIMGLGAQMLHWGDTLVQGLLDRGFRVVLLDNRDAGLSQKFYELPAPPVWWTGLKDRIGVNAGVPYTLSDMAADAAGLLQQLDIERAHVVGASMGGMIAQVMAAEHPQRVRSLTSIMSSSGAPELPEPQPQAVKALASAADPADSRREMIERGVAITRAIGSPEFFDEAVARNVTERVINRGAYGDGMLRQFQAIVASGDRSSLLRGITAPTLVIHGEADPLLPVGHGRDTAEKIPSARFAPIAGMAHGLEPVTSERVLEVLVPFLREH